MTKKFFKNKKILITAGPTRELLDPVRYISNHSSGKMGYAIAQTFLEQGATVFLVSGPVALHIDHPNLELIKVISASEMFIACCRVFESVDIAVFAAAVADYRPRAIASQKIKKKEDSFTIKLVKNVDIAFEFGKVKKLHQLSIGFALETDDELAQATSKMERKNFDMIVLNSMKDKNQCFEYDNNKIQIIKRDYSRKSFVLKPKSEVAKDIICEIEDALGKDEFRKEEVDESLYEFSHF